MSKTATIKECEIFTRKRAAQKPKTTDTPAEEEKSANNMADIAAVLTELRLLRSEFGEFGAKLDNIDDRLGKMASSITTLEKDMSEVKRDVATNAARMEEAERRIVTTEEQLEGDKTALINATKRIAYLESKTEDLENRSRRKNLRLFGLREGAEGGGSLLEFVRGALPRWLELETDRSFILERAHRTLAAPKPGQNRAVLIRFLNFQDREFVFRSTRQRSITHDGCRLSFAQDFSTETIRQRREFDVVKKKFIDNGTFRGFHLNPCKMRVLHNGKIHLLSTSKEAEEFLRGHD